MREILEAVDHIHSRGLIHRDIKPENIMFHDTSNEPASPKTPASKKAVKLIDFDTCQEYEPKSPRARHIVGTLGYLAPEALQGDYSPAPGHPKGDGMIFRAFGFEVLLRAGVCGLLPSFC
ncbi:Melk [Symbiodinium sp. CCMP2456]|nr:Melk [Symbiodinium sp. CCMP2456]